MANSTIQAARKRSRVRMFHCNTWSTAQIFEHRSQDDESHHDLDARHPAAAAGQPLEVRGKQRQQKERQRQTGGKRNHAEHRPRSAALHRGRQQRARRTGPTQANEVSENVRPMSSVPAKPPCEARSSRVSRPREA